MECGAVLKSKAAAKKHLIQVHNYQCTSKRKHLRQQQQQQQQMETQMQQLQYNTQAASSALGENNFLPYSKCQTHYTLLTLCFLDMIL